MLWGNSCVLLATTVAIDRIVSSNDISYCYWAIRIVGTSDWNTEKGDH